MPCRWRGVVARSKCRVLGAVSVPLLAVSERGSFAASAVPSLAVRTECMRRSCRAILGSVRARQFCRARSRPRRGVSAAFRAAFRARQFCRVSGASLGGADRVYAAVVPCRRWRVSERGSFAASAVASEWGILAAVVASSMAPVRRGRARQFCRAVAVVGTRRFVRRSERGVRSFRARQSCRGRVLSRWLQFGAVQCATDGSSSEGASAAVSAAFRAAFRAVSRTRRSVVPSAAVMRRSCHAILGGHGVPSCILAATAYRRSLRRSRRPVLPTVTAFRRSHGERGVPSFRRWRPVRPDGDVLVVTIPRLTIPRGGYPMRGFPRRVLPRVYHKGRFSHARGKI